MRARVGYGSTAAPPPGWISKCKCGPVASPVAPSTAGLAPVVRERCAGERARHPVDDLHRTSRGEPGEAGVDPVELVERALPLLLLGGELVALRDKLGVQRAEIGGQAIVGLV